MSITQTLTLFVWSTFPGFNLYKALTLTARECGADRVVAFFKLRSEKNESLLNISFNALDFLADDVEANGLSKGSALSDSDDISGTEAEGGGAMSGQVLVTLLKSVVLLDVMEVISADDNVAVHFCGNNNTPNSTHIIINK